MTGDGVQATEVELLAPEGIEAGGLLTGDAYIADTGNDRILHVDAAGFVRTVASSTLSAPLSTSRVNGSVYVADAGNGRIASFTDAPPPTNAALPL